MAIKKPENVEIKSFAKINNIEKQMSDLKFEKKSAQKVLRFKLDKYDDLTCKKIFKMANMSKEKYDCKTIYIYGSDFQFHGDDLKELQKLQDSLSNAGIKLYISDKINLYLLEETVEAFYKANVALEEIKKFGNSPFEKFLLIYQYLTKYAYHDNLENPANSREIISILNGNDIVCVGYAKLMEYMCREVGITCKTQECEVFKNGGRTRVSHLSNLVFIDDDTYKIHGVYHADACWDSLGKLNEFDSNFSNESNSGRKDQKGKKKVHKYNYCLIPTDDMNHLDHVEVEFDVDTLAFYSDNYEELFYTAMVNDKVYCKMVKQGGQQKGKIKFKKDFETDRKNAVKKLKEIFKKECIPEDVYKYFKDMPELTKPENLIYLCMNYETNKDYIKYIIDYLYQAYSSLKVNFNNNYKDKKLQEEFFKDKMEVAGNYNDYFEWIINKKATKKDLDNFTMIYSKSANLAKYFEGVKLFKEHTRVINCVKFKKALIQIYINQGYREEDAKKMVIESMNNTATRSGSCFNEDAENEFRKVLTEYIKQFKQ